MKKVSTVGTEASRNFSQQKLTVGLDLGDRNSWPSVAEGTARNEPLLPPTRKLAVLLHHLWVSGEVYEPLHHSRAITVAAVA